MIIVVTSGFITVDGVPRKVDTAGLLPQDADQLEFDTVVGEGQIQYKRGAYTTVVDRDLAEEERQNADLRRRNKKILEQPIMKQKTIQKPPEIIKSLPNLQALHNRWLNAGS